MAPLIMVSMKLKNQIIPCLGNADGAKTTSHESHGVSPETPILGPTDRATIIKVDSEVLLLFNMILRQL
jgi:hypothetical protein